MDVVVVVVVVGAAAAAAADIVMERLCDGCGNVILSRKPIFTTNCNLC